ncbi:rhomboid family intramembrane serine protease [Gordonia shandongensis]|uniref:rhomboid family intramembrane serine protease n=1 Tax=Gordonia shandongensis TaxID=376351 RepID=UPI00047E20CA|nr:rhomboid family intramembrane serine protease [Gordonia shandongensis]
MGTAESVALETESRAPMITYALIAVNVIIYLACALESGSIFDPRASTVMQYGALITGDDFDNEYWRLVTSGFLHWSILHLAVNMLALYLIGADLERVFGPLRYMAVYGIGLLGGSAAVMAFEGGQVVTAGASGAIYGLMGALLVVVVRIKAPASTIITVIVINLVISLTIPGISLLGHLGGLVFGAASAAGVLWLPTAILPPEKRTYRRVNRIGWATLAALLILALAIGTGIAVSDSIH